MPKDTQKRTSTDQTCLAEGFFKAIDQHDAITFDVFDTLLHRELARPIDVFKLVATRIPGQDPALAVLAANFQSFRVVSERKARQRKIADFGHGEVSMEDIYTELAGLAHISTVDAMELRDIELQVEHELVYANPLMKQVLEYAQTKGKKVLLCSDMYLSRTVIHSLLTAVGYTNIPDILVSCELGKSKHAGDIFPFVVELLAAPPGRILHIGDHKDADYQMARKHGFNAILFDLHEIHSSVTHRHTWSRDEEWGSRSLPTAIMRGLLVRAQMTRPSKVETTFRKMGREIFGPYFLGKMIWLAESARRDKIEKILFFARDAQFEFELYTNFADALRVEIPADYMYVSRAALLHASFTDFAPERLWSLIAGHRVKRTVGEWLTSVGIDSPWIYIDAIRRAGFRDPDDQSNGGDNRLWHLLSTLHAKILETAAEKRKIAAAYLSRCIGNASRIGIVDIGWLGNMQAAFSRIASLPHPDLQLYGYYSGTLDDAARQAPSTGKLYGYFCQDGVPVCHSKAVQEGGAEILEFVHMADHGTTLGYEVRQGIAQPILEISAEDQAMRNLSREIKDGVTDYFSLAMPLVKRYSLATLNSPHWNDELFRLIRSPSIEEAAALGEITHSEGVGETVQQVKLAPVLPLVKRLPFLKTYRRAKRQAFWKSGFRERNRIL